MEMNTRIQVEHCVTEEVTDTDLIEWQLRIADGEKITFPDQFPVGHAIECRINAEDPFRNFAPSPGTITAFHTPKGLGVRCDTHAFAGYRIPPTYDSMIAKLIVRDKTRARAIEKMRRALDEFIVEGVKTTIPFHQQLLRDERFRAGDFDTLGGGDSITDFLSGTDRISFRNLGLTFIESDAFTAANSAPEVRWNEASERLEVDLNGDNTADGFIRLQDGATVVASDLIL